MSVSCLPGLCPRSPPLRMAPRWLGADGKDAPLSPSSSLTYSRWSSTFVWKKVLVQPWQLPEYPSHTDHRQPVHDALSGGEPQGTGRSRPHPSSSRSPVPLLPHLTSSRALSTYDTPGWPPII